MNELSLSALHLGELLAEGGEGRVFEVAGGPGLVGERLVYKQLRQPCPLAALTSLVAFPADLAEVDAALSARVLSSSAWPIAAVVGDDPAMALGTVMPRAPRAFWLSHRDGGVRLATLSYLASDPDRITVAYGAEVPGPGTPERVAVVYALCRFLEACQGRGGQPHVVHGDLSAKNVLWSLRPTPGVYVLDCDGAAVGDLSDDADDGIVTGREAPPERQRATTANWDDPSLPRGAVPTEASDRYILGLAFLRVVGAAHFPLQGRQRTANKVSVDLELPRSWRRFPDMPRLWELCERSLSLVNADDRPSPAEWAAQIEELLRVQGASELATAVRLAQGDPRPGWPPSARSDRNKVPAGARAAVTGAGPVVTVPDVEVRPVLRHRASSTWQLINARPSVDNADGDGLVGLGLSVTLTPRDLARRIMAAWAGAHQLAARLVRLPGRRRDGFRRLASVVLLDLAAACVVVFLVGMIVSPWIGL